MDLTELFAIQVFTWNSDNFMKIQINFFPFYFIPIQFHGFIDFTYFSNQNLQLVAWGKYFYEKNVIIEAVR